MQQDVDKPVLVLANGKKVLPDGRVVSEVVVPQPAAQMHREIVSGRTAQRTLERIHRRLGDLPETPEKMNPIVAVMGYTAIGLNDADIASALGATEAQIKVLKESEPYKQVSDMFDRTVFEDARRNARHIVAQASDRAAQRMVEAIDSGDESIAVVASREIMKTAGISLEEESKKSLSGLKIVVEKADSDTSTRVTVQMDGD